MEGSRRVRAWKVIAFAGVGFVALGLGVASLDFATIGRFEFIDEHFDLVFLSIGVGAILSIVGLVAWAKHIGRQPRALMAAVVFALPLVTCLLAALIAGTNVHGLFPLFLLPMVPASVLALILLLMAAAGSKS